MARAPEVAVLIPALGQGLLLAAAATGVLATAAHLVARVPAAWRRWLGVAHAASLGGALLLLAGAFLAGRLEVAYVWEHTLLTYPWWYKLAGVWAGQKGTVVLWGALLAVVGVTLARRDGPVTRGAAAVVLALSTAFAGHAFVDQAFLTTPGAALDGAPTGRGLQEVLVTPFMVVHPPVQFVAYALALAVAAIAVAGLWTGAPARTWARAAMGWAQPAWLFATLGLGLGALWAYHVLSFGGYWAWDPVEVANLLPWLALTVFVHAGKFEARHGDFPLLAPVAALLAGILTFFATFETRSGLWVSVHAFTDPTRRFSPDAPTRLMAILDAHPPTAFFLTLVVVLLLMGVVALDRGLAARDASWRRPARAHAVVVTFLAAWAAVDVRGLVGAWYEVGALLPLGRPSVGAAAVAAVLLGAPAVIAFLRDDHDESPRLTERTLVKAGVALLVLALVLTLVLNLQVVNTLDRAPYDARAPFVAIPLVLVLTFTMALAPLGRRGALLLMGLGVVAGAAGAVLAPDARVVAASVPVLLAALLACAAKLVHVNGADASPRERGAGGALLATGLAVMVVGASPPSVVAGFETGAWHGAAVVLLGLAVTLAGVAVLRGLPTPGGAPRAVAGARQTGIYLIHLALVVGLLGYAASTYAAERVSHTTDDPLLVGETATVGGVQLVVRTPKGAPGDGDAEWYSRLVVPFDVMRDGRVTDSAAWEFYHNPDPINHYDPVLVIRRGLTEDLYVSVEGVRLADGTWIEAHGDACYAPGPARPSFEGTCATTVEVDAVAFDAFRLPFVNLVWAGLWMMVAGMGLVLAARVGEGWRQRAAVAAASSASQNAQDTAPR